MKGHLVVAETLCMIYRYCYYVKGAPMVTDDFYDRLEPLAINSGMFPKSPLHIHGSDLDTDYIMPMGYPTIALGDKLIKDPHYLDNLVEKVTPHMSAAREAVSYID
jgi:hypothetical protein